MSKSPLETVSEALKASGLDPEVADNPFAIARASGIDAEGSLEAMLETFTEHGQAYMKAYPKDVCGGKTVARVTGIMGILADVLMNVRHERMEEALEDGNVPPGVLRKALDEVERLVDEAERERRGDGDEHRPSV